jgi:serine/threonine-protein kinase
MDLVAGRSLADAIDAGRLDRSRLFAVLAQVAGALAYVHGAGLVHRDLKPENILLADGFWENPNAPGTVKLVDFGIAASAKNTTNLTTPGMIVGTLPYLAPELLDPASWGRNQGPARDVFAFGVMASRLLLGKHPTGLGFDATPIDYARAYKAAEAGRIAWPPNGLEGSWGAVVRACLALRSVDRPADGAAMLDVLRTGVPPRRSRSSWTDLSGPTSPHRAPLPSTEPMPAPTVGMTAPMSLPPQSVQRNPVAGERASVPVAPERSRRGLSALLYILLGALISAAIFVYFGPSFNDRASPTPSAITPSPTPVPSPNTTRGTASAAISACRRPNLPFDPQATRFECPVCEAEPAPLPPRGWQMRINGVTGPTPMPRPELEKKICAQVSGGKALCVPFSELPDKTGAAGRLPVTTADINEGRIYVSIRDDDGIIAKGFAHRKPGTTAFLGSALCLGFVLYLDNSNVIISVFLDDH